MCSNCDTEYELQTDAIYCCQCESCAEFKKQLDAVRSLQKYTAIRESGKATTNVSYVVNYDELLAALNGEGK